MIKIYKKNIIFGENIVKHVKSHDIFTEFDAIVELMSKIFLEQKFNIYMTMLHKSPNDIKFHVGAKELLSKYDEGKFLTRFLI